MTILLNRVKIGAIPIQPQWVTYPLHTILAVAILLLSPLALAKTTFMTPNYPYDYPRNQDITETLSIPGASVIFE